MSYIHSISTLTQFGNSNSIDENTLRVSRSNGYFGVIACDRLGNEKNWSE